MIQEQKTRIVRFLAGCGLGSRRSCGQLVKDGRISVNRYVTRDPSMPIGSRDVVRMDDRVVRPQETTVMAVNKPPGYLSTARDERGRKTVLQLTGDNKKRLYPAGRLDRDSRGLIIVTNDGDLAYRVTHPKFNIPKTYEVSLDRSLEEKDLERLGSGFNIDGKRFRPDFIRRDQKNINGLPLVIRIHSGRKRIIRRAFEKIGYKVTDLRRTAIGGYCLGDLPEGKCRQLDRKDIKRLTMSDDKIE